MYMAWILLSLSIQGVQVLKGAAGDRIFSRVS